MKDAAWRELIALARTGKVDGCGGWMRPSIADGLIGPQHVLAEAVRVNVITAGAAELIAATRLHGEPLSDYAGRVGESAKCLDSRRERAEAKLATAITKGHVSVMTAESLQNPGC